MLSIIRAVPDSIDARPGDGVRAQYERRRAARLRRDPASAASAHELAYLKGADGEQKLGTRLNEDAALVGGVAVLHNLVLPGRQADIDHLVIGPSGITVVDAKAWAGALWVGRKVIGRGRSAHRKPVAGVLDQVARVRAVLVEHGRGDVPVEGALCFVAENPGIPARGLPTVDGVRVGVPAQVSRHAMRPGPYAEAEVADLMRVMRGAFSVGGGAQAPSERGRAAPRVRSVVPGPRGGAGARRRRASAPRRRRRAGDSAAALAARLAFLVALLAGLPQVMTHATEGVRHALAPLSVAEANSHRAEYRHLAQDGRAGPSGARVW